EGAVKLDRDDGPHVALAGIDFHLGVSRGWSDSDRRRLLVHPGLRARAAFDCSFGRVNEARAANRGEGECWFVYDVSLVPWEHGAALRRVSQDGGVCCRRDQAARGGGSWMYRLSCGASGHRVQSD